MFVIKSSGINDWLLWEWFVIVKCIQHIEVKVKTSVEKSMKMIKKVKCAQ